MTHVIDHPFSKKNVINRPKKQFKNLFFDDNSKMSSEMSSTGAKKKFKKRPNMINHLGENFPSRLLV